MVILQIMIGTIQIDMKRRSTQIALMHKLTIFRQTSFCGIIIWTQFLQFLFVIFFILNLIHFHLTLFFFAKYTKQQIQNNNRQQTKDNFLCNEPLTLLLCTLMISSDSLSAYLSSHHHHHHTIH